MQSNLNGVWISRVGSTLILTEEPVGVLNGTMDSTQDLSGPEPLHGSSSRDPQSDNRGLSFSISWPAGKSSPDKEQFPSSVTAYAGKYQKRSDGSEEIEVIFLIADGSTPGPLWQSVGISSDVFKRKAKP